MGSTADIKGIANDVKMKEMLKTSRLIRFGKNLELMFEARRRLMYTVENEEDSET